MTDRLAGPVGRRFRTQPVENQMKDQELVITLLGSIPASQGGKQDVWKLFPGPGQKGECPKALVDAIWDFQTFWQAKGYCRVVDGVVDKDLTTFRKLQELAGGDLPKPMPEVIPATTIDVVVGLVGSMFQVPLDPDEVFPDNLLDIYSQKKSRRLVRFGTKTATIRNDSARMISDLVNAFQGHLVNLTIGKVFIYGSSSGGRNALDLAAALAKAKIPVTLVALMDAAWFPNETKTVPNSWTGDPTNAPKFTHPDFKADVELDFFQLAGNHLHLGKSGRQFTSNMGGHEIHGLVENFQERDLTVEVRGAGDDDALHRKLITAARPRVFAAIKQILDGL